MKKQLTFIFILLVSNSLSSVFAAEQIEPLLKQYQQQGAGEFSVEAGKALWQKEVSHQKAPATRSCASCHGSNLTLAGEHAKTGKAIKPMAPSVNTARFNKQKKIEKWFRRNCKWTWGRECSVQEKGDILRYLSQQ